MGKSYRKPYVFMTKGIRESHASDKKIANRSFRRMANRDLQNCLDWDELLTPHRFEARHNNVYSWAGDGHAQLNTPWKGVDNPFDHTSYCCYTMYGSELHQRWLERLQRDEEYDRKIRRK